jgi:uncharacterized C2H2 Zn-finger protein
VSDEHPVVPDPPVVIQEADPPEGKEPCPHCGKLLTHKSLPGHVRKQHNIYIRRPRGRPPGVRNRPKLALTVVRNNPERLTPEQITQATAAMLWPEGVPLDRLERLLRWHTQTAVFLDMVQDSE